MKRTPLARGTTGLRRTRLAAVSDKRTVEWDDYRDAKLAVNARDLGHCQLAAAIPEVPCAGRMDPCHVDARGRGGRLADPANILTGCRAHHRWTEDHARQARERGLIL